MQAQYRGGVLVLEGCTIDETSKWKAFADYSGDHNPNRVGGPVNQLLGDRALITVTVGPVMRECHMNPVHGPPNLQGPFLIFFFVISN